MKGWEEMSKYPSEEWLKKYYPVSAEEIVKDKNISTKQLVLHSIQKWEGLYLRNRKPYGIGISGIFNTLIDENLDEVLRMGCESCTLCLRFHWMWAGSKEAGICEDCPITLATGSPCDVGDSNPWRIWANYHNPTPMLTALKKALVYCEENGI